MTTLQHHRWDPNGRTFRELDDQDRPTGRFVYSSQHGEQQIQVDSGEWFPYLVDPNTGDVKFAGGAVSRNDTSQSIIVGTSVLATSQIFVDRWDGEEWVSAPHGLPITSAFPNDNDTYSIVLDFPDADYDLQTKITVGRSRRATMTIRLIYPVDARLRVQVVNDKMNFSQCQWIETRYDPNKQKTPKRIGVRCGGLDWIWSLAESDEREIHVDENTDGTKKLTINMGPYDVSANKRLIIHPDQWGPTGIANTNDDCSQTSFGTVDLDGADSDGSYVGDVFGGLFNVGLRFQNVAVSPNPASVDAGTQIEYDCGYAEGPLFNFNVYGLEGDIAEWSVSPQHGPSDETRTNAVATFVRPNSGLNRVIDGADFRSVVQEVLDTSWSSGFDMGFEIDRGTASGGFFQIEDFSTGTAARLTIVYTPSGTFTKVANTDADAASGGSLTCDRPPGTVEDDIMFSLIQYHRNEDVSSSPTGWTQLASIGYSTDFREEIWYKVAGASEPANYTWAHPSSTRFSITIVTYRGGFDINNPIDTFSSVRYTVENTTWRAAGVNVSAVNSPLLFFAAMYSVNNSVSWTAPTSPVSGWIEDVDLYTFTGDHGRAIYSLTWAGSGATGDVDATGSLTANIDKMAFLVALNPVPSLNRADKDIAWRIFNQSDKNIAWKLFNQEDKNTSWKILNRANKDIAWKVFNQSDKEVSWKILNRSDKDIAWNILNRANKDIAWKLFNRSDKDVAWRIVSEAPVEPIIIFQISKTTAFNFDSTELTKFDFELDESTRFNFNLNKDGD